MNFVALFKQAGQLVWREKQWWVLGVMLGIGDIISGMTRLFASLFLPNLPSRLTGWANQFRNDPFGVTPIDLAAWGSWIGLTAVSLILGSIIIWLLVTWAEAGLITAVYRAHHNRSTSIWQALRTGYRFLSKFIQIDALVFLPWFLLALLIMFLFMGGTIATAVSVTQSTSNISNIGTILGTVGLICIIPLSLLLIPLGYLSFIYRLLAFRDAAMLGHGVRKAVRHTGQVIRRNMGEVVLMIILLSGGLGIVNSLLGWITIPLFSLTAVITPATVLTIKSVLIVTIVIAGFLLITGLKVILSMWATAVWTLAYVKWVKAL